MYVKCIWWGWRNHKAELAIVQQPLSTKYDMEWNLLLFTTRLLARSVSTKGWRFMKKGLIFLMFLFFTLPLALMQSWLHVDQKLIQMESIVCFVCDTTTSSLMILNKTCFDLCASIWKPNQFAHSIYHLFGLHSLEYPIKSNWKYFTLKSLIDE